MEPLGAAAVALDAHSQLVPSESDCSAIAVTLNATRVSDLIHAET